MSEPVKIVIQEVREGNAAEEEMRRIQQLHQAADKYSKTPGMEAAAKSARSEAFELQKKQIGAATATAAAERAMGNDAAANAATREAAQMQRTLSLQRQLNLGYDEALMTARAELATKEEEAALQRVGISQGSSGLRGGRLGQFGQFFGGNLRGAGELGSAVAVGLMVQRAIDAQTEALRDSVAQTRNQGYEIDQRNRHTDRALKTVNGPSAEYAMEQGMEDESQGLAKDVQDKQDQIDRMEKEKGERVASWSVIAGGVGGLLGAPFGGVGAPVGAAVGAGIGAGAAALYNRFAINPQEDQLKAQQGMDSGEKGLVDQQRKKLEEQRKSDFQDELSMSEAEAHYDFKTVRRLQEKIEWTKKYREAKSEGADEQQAQEAANLQIWEERKKIAQQMGNSLVSTKTGNYGAAVAAQLASQYMADPTGYGSGSGPAPLPLDGKIDALHNTLRTMGHAVIGALTTKDQAGTPLRQ
jgi:hypothetical protein